MSSIRFENLNDLSLRAITGICAGSVVLAALVIGAPLFNLILAICAIIAASEVQVIVTKEKTIPALPALSALVLILAATLKSYEILIAGILLVGIWSISTGGGQKLILGGLAVGIPFGLLIFIRDGELGLSWCLMIVANTWATDSMAYIGGKMYGKTKLAPSISPAKTVEGAAIGITSGVICGVLLGSALSLPLIQLVMINLFITAAAVLGDLTESKIKRHYQVKDSGTILPGHGGILDRIDGLLAAITIAAVFAI